MPNTKSAERRVRSSETKRIRNQAVASRIRTLEKNFRAAITEAKKEPATLAFRAVISAMDKAVKTGVVTKGTADRKKSRLALTLGKLK